MLRLEEDALTPKAVETGETKANAPMGAHAIARAVSWYFILNDYAN